MQRGAEKLAGNRTQHVRVRHSPSRITALSGVQNQRTDLPFLGFSLTYVTSTRVPSGKPNQHALRERSIGLRLRKIVA